MKIKIIPKTQSGSQFYDLPGSTKIIEIEWSEGNRPTKPSEIKGLQIRFPLDHSIWDVHILFLNPQI